MRSEGLSELSMTRAAYHQPANSSWWDADGGREVPGCIPSRSGSGGDASIGSPLISSCEECCYDSLLSHRLVTIMK